MSEKTKVWFTIEVEPRQAGDFGFASMSGIRYTERELETLAADMVADIQRHVANVDWVRVKWEFEE